MKQIKQEKVRSNFFDAALFRYVLKTVFKRASVYVSSLAFFIMIFAVTFIAPIAGPLGPIEIITNPIVAVLLVFGCSVIAALYMIEIFRTPIEDGTEIITVSKPLSRIEIVLVKISVFILMIFLVAFLAAIVSLLLYTQNVLLFDGLYIVIGIFSGILISCFIFGGLTLILLIYSRKIVSLMIVFGISFTFTIFTVFITLFSKTPIQVINQTNNNLALTQILSLDDESLKNNEYKTNYITGVINSTADGNNSKKPSEVYQDALNVSSWTKISYLDFGSQLSSFFYSNKAPSTQRYFSTSGSFLTPNILKFTDYDNGVSNNTKLSFNLGGFEKLLDANNEELDLGINKTFSFNKSWWFSSTNKNVDQLTLWHYFSLNPSEYYSSKGMDTTLFEEYWDKYGEQVKKEYYDFYQRLSDPNSGLADSQNYYVTPLSILFNIVAKNEFNVNKSNIIDFYDFQRNFIWSSYSYFVKNVLTTTDETTNTLKISPINVLSLIDLFHLDKNSPDLFYSKSKILVKDLIPDYNSLSQEIKGKFDTLFEMTIDENTEWESIQNKAYEFADSNELANNSKYEFFKNLKNDVVDNRVKNITLLNSIGIDVKNLINNNLNSASLITTNVTINDDGSSTTTTSYLNNYIKTYTSSSFVMDSTYNGEDINKNYYDIFFGKNVDYYSYATPILLRDSSYYSQYNFQSTSVQQLYSSYVIYPIWIGVGLTLFIIGSCLYYKKDFA